MGQKGALRKFAKYAFGYWGEPLFHFGIILTVIFSLMTVLTQQYGTLSLVEGEEFGPHCSWTYEDLGLLSKPLVFPAHIKLEKVSPTFYETGEIQNVSVSFSGTHSLGLPFTSTLSMDEQKTLPGVDSAHIRNFGKVCRLGFVLDGAESLVSLYFSHPQNERPSYDSCQDERKAFSFKGKFFSDHSLIIRMMNGQNILDEKRLLLGQTIPLGPGQVSFREIESWVEIVFSNVTGMWGVFAGFACMVSGVGLVYFFPPREVYLKSEEEGESICWRPTRFTECFQDERDFLLKELKTIREEGKASLV